MAALTAILLPCRLGRIPPRLRHFRRAAVGTADPVRPPQRANGFVALDLIQRILKVDHRRGPSVAAVEHASSVAPDLRPGEPSSTVWNPY